MFKGSTLFSVSPTALQFPLRRVAKCRAGLVAKSVLDSICQNLSMHVTRTTLLIGDLAKGEKKTPLAIPNDTIREHIRPVRVVPVHKFEVATTESHRAPATLLPCVESRNPNRHSFAPVAESFYRIAHRVRVRHVHPLHVKMRCGSKRSACGQTASPRTHVAIFDSRDKKTTIFTTAANTWRSRVDPWQGA